MAVAHDFASESHTGTTGSTSETSFTWSHNPVGTPRGVLVFVYTLNTNVDIVSSVTYDGASLTAISGGRAADTAGEPGSVQTWFLGSSVPTTDPADVVVTRSNTADILYAICITVTAGGNTEITGIVLEEENQVVTEENVDDGSPGTNSIRYCGAYYGGARLTAGDIGANSTFLHDLDVGPRSAGAAVETTAGQGSRPVGFSVTTDDWCAVYLAVREVASGTTVTPAVVAAVVTVPTPTILAAAKVTPAVIARAVTVPIPTVAVPATAEPAVIATVVTVPTPTVQAAATVTPAAIPTVASLPTPTVLGAAVVTPATIRLGSFGYASFPDTAGQRIVTPDHASLDITGDIDIRALAWFTDNVGWHAIVAKGDVPLGTPGGSGSYSLERVDAASSLQLSWDDAAGGSRNQASTTGIAVDQAWRWYRVTLDVDNGSSQHVVTFYYSDDSVTTDPASVSWTQHSQHTVAGVTSILARNDDLWLGDQLNEGDTMDGRIGYVEIRDGINGTIVANPDFRDRDQQTGTSPVVFTDDQTKTWTFTTATWESGTILPTPTIDIGGAPATVTPATIAAVVALPTPTIQAASTITPSTIAAIAALPTPNVQAGAVVTPTTIATVVTVPIPAVLAAATVAPAVITTTVAVPTPSILIAPTVTPAVIAVTTTVPTPTVVVEGGPTTVSPAVIATVAALPTPSVLAAALVGPATIATVAALPIPTVQAAALVAPAAIDALVAVPTPTVQAGATVTPGTIALVVTLPTPGVQAGAVVTPGVIAAVVTVPTPIPGIPGLVTPATIVAVVTVPGPTIVAGAVVTPGVIPIVVTVPTPTVIVPAGPVTTFTGPAGSVIRNYTAREIKRNQSRNIQRWSTRRTTTQR